MIEALIYALFCGFAVSALLVPLTAVAMRRTTGLGGGIRHMIWSMVLLATVGATGVALAVSALRPAKQFSHAFVATAALAPVRIHVAGVPLAALGVFFLTCWFIVSIARTFFLARQILFVRAMKQSATPIDLDFELPRGAKTLASESCAPSAVGFLHPAILLPSGMMGALDSVAVRQILLHEAAHLRRRDDLTGLVFRLCAATFWFNPFMHYIGRQLSLECEIACDEIVVEQDGDAKRYAGLLFDIAQSINGERPTLVWNSFVHPSGLIVRIQHLLHHRHAGRRVLPWPALGVLTGMSLLSVALAAFNAPALGRAEHNASVTAAQRVLSDSAALKLQVTNGQRRVHDFPVCNPRKNTGGAHSDAKFCEATIPPTSSTTRIKRGTATP